MRNQYKTVTLSLVVFIALILSACDDSGNGSREISPLLGIGIGTTGGDNTGSGDPVTGDPGDGTDGNVSQGETDNGTGDTGIVKLVFVGDTMMARKVKKSVVNNGRGDYGFLFRYTADFLSGADLAFLNLESMISDSGTVMDWSNYYMGISFRADPAAMEGLTDAGIDVVSVANNHAFDYSRSAFDDCLTRLSAAGIVPVGGGSFEEAYAPKVIEVRGTKIAYLAFTLVGNSSESSMQAQKDDAAKGTAAQSGVAWYYSEYADPAIERARNAADVVVVSIHFGDEYETVQDSDQEAIARRCIDRGANLVVGHHPHVVQPLASYGGGYIAYSLGNFVFDQSDEDTHRGMVLEVTVRDKKIESAVDSYIHINDQYQPVPQ